MYTDELNTLKRLFGQTQTVVSVHLDKLNRFQPLEMHYSERIISFASIISSLVGVFKSPVYSSKVYHC